MFIRHQGILLALTLCILSWLSLPTQLILISIIFIYHLKRFPKYHLLFLCICLLFLLRMHIPISNTPSHIVKISEVKSNYCIATSNHTKVILYGLENIHPDDILEIEGNYQPIENVMNRYSFHFNTWCQRKNITSSMNVTHSSIIQHGTTIKHHLYTHIQSMQPDTKKLLNMTLYGIHEEDASYLLLSSGLHISFILSYLKKHIKNTKHSNIYMHILFILLCLMAHISTPSTIYKRLICFNLCDLLFMKEDRKFKFSISMILTLFCFPYLGSESGFLLPYAFYYMQLFCIEKYSKLFMNFMILFPFQLYYYHCFQPLEMILFKWKRILYAIIYIASWILLIIPNSIFVNILITIIDTIQSIQLPTFNLYGNISIVCILWYIFMILKLWHKKTWIIQLEYTCLILMILFSSYLSPFVKIITIDVGQGDCSVIILPHKQKVIMIDCMGSKNKNIPKDIIVPRLHAEGITKIDLMILTHNDFDHSGGVTQLQEIMSVDKIVNQKKDIKQYEEDWMKFLLCDYQGEDENDNSIITMLSFYKNNILFMGDLGKKGEAKILDQYPNISSSIIKIGHHGSSTSSSIDFIHQLQPKIAIISAGRNNYYGHPDPNVVKLLHNENIYTHITSKQGESCIYLYHNLRFFINGLNEIGLF